MENANRELTAAIPAMEAAEASVDCLSVKSIVHLSSLSEPQNGSELVMRAVCIMLGGYNAR